MMKKQDVINNLKTGNYYLAYDHCTARYLLLNKEFIRIAKVSASTGRELRSKMTKFNNGIWNTVDTYKYD